MPIDTDWFRNRLDDRRMSQRDLARHLGLDAAAVSLMLRGKRVMKISEAVAIARLIGVTADEVLSHSGAVASPNGKMIPISFWMDETAEIHTEDQDVLVPHPSGDLPEAIAAIQCRTVGTALDHMDGWVMFVSSIMEGSVQADAVGRLSLIRLRDGVMCIAKLSRGMKRGRWNLVSPIGTIKDAEVEWASPILLVTP